MIELVIDKRFCGPRASANGGYAAGMFAQMIDGPAQVTLLAPPPLGEKIEIHETGEGTFEARHGATLIARITPASVSVDPPALPDSAGVSAARGDFLEDADGEHLLPYCFVCGDKRDDGLRIFAGPAPGSPMNADYWTPKPDLAGDDGLVRAEFLWAALDCPGAFALRNGLRLCLLGRFAVEIIRRPAPGEKLIVAAWRTGEDGRKHFSSSALYDKNRKIIAAANAVWIELTDPAFLEKLRVENA